LDLTVESTVQNSQPTITGSSSATGVVGTAFRYVPTVADADASDTLIVSYSSQNALPSGLTFNPSTGVISGTPTRAGSGVYVIKVSDGVASAELTVTVTITTPTGATGASF
jgi:hypothetical protein